MLTPRAVRLVLLPAAYLTFLIGTLISAAVFYRTRPFDLKTAILSDLQSPDENPHGFEASATGTALSAILLAPAASLFYAQLRKAHPRLALAGLLLFATGLMSAAAIGVLAPFTHGYTPLHIQLASAAFIGVGAGTWLYLVAARAAPGLLIFQFAALLLLASSATARSTSITAAYSPAWRFGSGYCAWTAGSLCGSWPAG
jgi:hypothetical protein